MNIIKKLNTRIDKVNSLLCVGLDSDYTKLPEAVKKKQYPQFAFNKAIIDATAEYVCAFKPNIAFYEARGEQGLRELGMTMDYIHAHYADIVTVCDAKRADIGNTNRGYVEYIFDHFGFDAITLHPYLGKEALQPFLERKDKASIILCRTSNPGAGELQDLYVGSGRSANRRIARMTMYEYVARQVAEEWNINNNCMLVVGATYPKEMKSIRSVVGDIPFLIPGIGVQGGDVKQTVQAGKDSKGKGMIINSARGIIFASSGADFATRAATEAKKLRDEINVFRS